MGFVKREHAPCLKRPGVFFMRKIYLIRHGQTDWNLQRRYQGRTDIDLNATGRAQARRDAIKMKKRKVNSIYASDLTRTLHFASIIFKGRKIVTMTGLREICFGIFEGLDHEEINSTYPDVYAKWLKKPFGIKIPQGEAPAEFKKRIMSAFGRILKKTKKGDIAVVTHGGVINVVLNELSGKKKLEWLVPELGSITTVAIDEKTGKMAKWVR